MLHDVTWCYINCWTKRLTIVLHILICTVSWRHARIEKHRKSIEKHFWLMYSSTDGWPSNVFLKLKMRGIVSSHPVLIDAKAAHPGIPWHCNQRTERRHQANQKVILQYLATSCNQAAFVWDLRCSPCSIAAECPWCLPSSARVDCYSVGCLHEFVPRCTKMIAKHDLLQYLLDHLDMSQQLGCFMLLRCPSTFHRVSCSPRCNSAWMKHWLPPRRTKDTKMETRAVTKPAVHITPTSTHTGYHWLSLAITSV